ncbi:MAG: glycosyltransferase, partial [Rectinemataceae bacterium]|nr:glycosyltransferase [Rectinemataceae bacterium]
MACGRPVIATQVGGVREVVTQAEVGYTVPPEDAAKLALALDRALSTQWDSSLIRRHAERFSWDISVTHCRKVWNEALQVYAHSKEKRVLP